MGVRVLVTILQETQEDNHFFQMYRLETYLQLHSEVEVEGGIRVRIQALQVDQEVVQP